MAAKKKKSASRRRGKAKVIIFVIEIVVLLIVLAVLYVSLKLSKIDTTEKFKFSSDTEEEDENTVERNELSQETMEKIDQYRTIAVFGLDNRSVGELDRGNSDTIMIISINNDTKEMKIASIYRDTYMNITDGDGYNKANAAYAHGGARQAVSMLNVNLDLDITEYVTVDFNAVIDAVDILGGVEIEVTSEEAYWINIYLEQMSEFTGRSADYIYGPGIYNMDGMQATAYARIRYTAGDDYKRTERQREVVQKMMDKALDSDLGTINELIDVVFPEVQTNLNQKELLMLAKDVFRYKIGDSGGFPVDRATADMPGAGDSVIALDLAAMAEQLHAFLYDAENYKVSDAVQNISDEIAYESGLSRDDLP